MKLFGAVFICMLTLVGQKASAADTALPLVDYCDIENITAGNCLARTMWEQRATCEAPKVAVAVSCNLSNYNGAALISNSVAANTGRCVWSIPEAIKRASSPIGYVTTLCK